MVKVRGGAPPNLEAVDEQRLLSDIETAVVGKTNLTDDEIVSLLRNAFPQTYSRCDRAMLLERVVKITPLPCRKGADICEPATVTYKRRIMHETLNVSGNDADSLDFEGMEVDDDQPESHECRDGRIIVRRNSRPRFTDLHMADSVIQELIREVIRPLRQFTLLKHLGIEPAPRILLHGPPGCGKTTLARAIATEARVPFYEVSAAALVSGLSGAPEENIRNVFSTAYTRAPSVVLIDELDVMNSKTDSSQKEVVPRLVNQLIACIDEPYSLVKPVNDDYYDYYRKPGYVLVIAATSMPDAIDPALSRRFDQELVIAAPDEKARLDILLALTRNLKVEVGFDLAKIARCTLGYVGGDLVALVKKAGTLAVNRIMDGRMKNFHKKQRVGVQSTDRCVIPDEEMENCRLFSITIEDFVEAGKVIQPSSKIERFSITPVAKWDDVGGLRDVKSEFKRHIVNRIKFPEAYKDLGVNLATIFFLFGPNGCGKTFVVEALANETGAKLIHVKGPELVKDYGDQAEWVVRLIFRYARTCSPCILFFDEVDAITLCCEDEPLPVFKQFLIELNDAKQSDLYVISATNRPETTHISLARGMYDKLLYVPSPSMEELLKAHARNKPIDADVDLMALAEDLPCNFTASDLSALMKAATKIAMDRPMCSGRDCSFPVPWTIKGSDIKRAMKKISPSGSRTQHKNCNLFSDYAWSWAR